MVAPSFDQTALESQYSEDEKHGKTDQYDHELGDENAPPPTRRSSLTLPSFRKAFRGGHKSSRML